MNRSAPYIGGTWKRHRVALIHRIVDMQLSLRLDEVCVDDAGFSADPDTVDVWVANHTSRYDGFLIWKVKHDLDPSGRLFTVMLADSLRKHAIFEGAGALGLSPGSAASVRSVVRFVESVPRAGDGLVIFPQGRIHAGDKVPPGFRSLTRIGARTGPPARFIPCAIAVEMLDGKRPTAFVRLGRPIPASIDAVSDRVEDAVSDVLRSLRDDLALYGEDLPEHWDELRPEREPGIRFN